MKKLISLATLCLMILPLSVPLRAAQPSTAGLQVWLDAGDGATLTRDAGGRILKWGDKSGHGHDALNRDAASNPQIVRGAASGLDVLRFNGKSDCFEVHGDVRRTIGPLTLFAVSRRMETQAGGKQWQRLISSSDGATTTDTRPPNISLMAALDGSAKAFAARIDDREYSDVIIKTLAIGRGAGQAQFFFAGDIAEILIYNRTFLSEDESHAVLNYLKDKWDARIAREDRGWTRVGLLPDPPRRANNEYPLSDQQNKGGWVRMTEFCDEFEGANLDRAKWRPEYPGWKGREPGRFSPYNVSVSGGQLHLVMRKGPIPRELEAPGFKDYTSAAVDSIKPAPYGYYEIMARPMNSGGSSSWWFSRTDKPKHGTEIDVFEIGGKALGFERKLNMNLHVWETPREKRHWNIGGAWTAPWRLADDFHVYGFEWDGKEIKYYVDGVIVRRVKNTDWHDPLHMQFDSETMPTWFGMPRDEDLPSTYSIEYIRAWRKKEDSTAHATPATLERVKTLCQNYTAGFVYSGTDLAYGRRINGPRGIGGLESPEAIAKRLVHGEYRPFGYGSGIEDLAYHNGMLLYALCDAEAATGDPFFAGMAQRAFAGLKRMSTLSKVEGFVPRGPHPDGKSYYPDSSLDQHSLYICGLWRYDTSTIASPADKTWIREMVAKVLRRLEKDGWSFLKEDGSAPSHAGGSMLKMEPTTAALLLVMLAAAHDVTGDAHWKEAYDRFSAEANGQRWTQLAKKIDRQRKPDWPRWNLFYNQDVLRTETLRRIEQDPARRAVLRGRIENMAEDMLTVSYFKTFRRLDWIGDEEASAAEADASANAYLKPLGMTVESGARVMDLWQAYNPSSAKEAMLGRRLTRYEPLLMATPAMVWQCALLSQKPELLKQVQPAIDEMLQRVDFSKVDLGWAYNYAVLAELWNLALPPVK